MIFHRDASGVPLGYLGELDVISCDVNRVVIKIEVILIESSSDTKANWFNYFISNQGALDIKYRQVDIDRKVGVSENPTDN